MVKALNELIEKHGDLHLVGREDGFGGYGMHLVEKPDSRLTTIGLDHFEEEPSAHVLKELFPDLEIPEEGIFDDDGHLQVQHQEIKCIEIPFGSLIYST